MNGNFFGYAFWGVLFVVTICILVRWAKNGFNLDFGWNRIKVSANKSKSLTVKECEALVKKEVAEAIKTHGSALEQYRQTIYYCDSDLKSSIARSISLLKVPVIPDSDFTSSRLQELAVRVELLVLNTENHYEIAASSQDLLTKYLTDKYIRFCQVYARYSEDEGVVQHMAYRTFVAWWGVVKPCLLHTLQQKIMYCRNSVNFFEDDTWREHLADCLKQLTDSNLVVTADVDLKALVWDYLQQKNMDEDFSAILTDDEI